MRSVLEYNSLLLIGLNAKESEKLEKVRRSALTASSVEDVAHVVNSRLYLSAVTTEQLKAMSH